MQFPHLFSPLQIGRVTVANRVSFSAHLTNLADDGLPTRAAHRLPGGPRPRRHGPHHHRGAVGAPHRPGLRAPHRGVPPRGDPRLQAAHRAPCTSTTRASSPSSTTTGSSAAAASRGCRCGRRRPSPTCSTARRPRPWSRRTSGRSPSYFARSAVHVREGGFDGVELQFGHSSLARQFMSPLTNFRGDEYGGEFENRMRFPLEVIAAVRDGRGPRLHPRRAALRRRAHPRRPHARRRQADRPAAAGHRAARLLQPHARHLLQPVPGRRPHAHAARLHGAAGGRHQGGRPRCRCSPPGASTTRPWPSGCWPTGRPT